MLGLKLNHVSKRGRCSFQLFTSVMLYLDNIQSKAVSHTLLAVLLPPVCGCARIWKKLCHVMVKSLIATLRWRHNDHAGVSNHQPRGCLLNRLFRRKSKKTSKLRVTGLCAGNSPGTGEFSAQMASYAENVSIWWRHHEVHAANMGPIWGRTVSALLCIDIA